MKNGLSEDLKLRKRERKHYFEFFRIFFLKEISNYCISMMLAMNFGIKRKSRKQGIEADKWDPQSVDRVYGSVLLVYGTRVHGTMDLTCGVHMSVSRSTMDQVHIDFCLGFELVEMTWHTWPIWTNDKVTRGKGVERGGGVARLAKRG